MSEVHGYIQMVMSSILLPSLLFLLAQSDLNIPNNDMTTINGNGNVNMPKDIE